MLQRYASYDVWFVSGVLGMGIVVCVQNLCTWCSRPIELWYRVLLFVSRIRIHGVVDQLNMVYISSGVLFGNGRLLWSVAVNFLGNAHDGGGAQEVFGCQQLMCSFS